MSKIHAAMICALILGGCAGKVDPNLPAVSITPKPEYDAANIIGTTAVTFRTFTEDKRNKKTEITGANCKVRSAEFVAYFTTPATVNFPVTKGKTPPLVATCDQGPLTDTDIILSKLPVKAIPLAFSKLPAVNLAATAVGYGVAKKMAEKKDIYYFVEDKTTYEMILK